MSQNVINKALSQLEDAIDGLEKAAKGMESKLKSTKNKGPTDLFGMPLKGSRKNAGGQGSPVIDPSLMARKLDHAISQVERILKDEAV